MFVVLSLKGTVYSTLFRLEIEVHTVVPFYITEKTVTKTKNFMIKQPIYIKRHILKYVRHFLSESDFPLLVVSQEYS